MANGIPAPLVGNWPYNEGDHATQLLADIAALQDFRASLAQKSKGKNLPWTVINLVFESVESYIKKSHDQPSIKELHTDLLAAEKANGTPRRDVALIKDTLDNLAGGLGRRTHRGPKQWIAAEDTRSQHHPCQQDHRPRRLANSSQSSKETPKRRLNALTISYCKELIELPPFNWG
jgi:hypothetical protein